MERWKRGNERRIMKLRVLLGVLFFVEGLSANCNPWACDYKHVFTEDKMVKNGKKNSLIIEEKEVHPFTQLIFSWNAYRPSNGQLHFYIRVRDSKTKSWDQWHKMVEWGSDKQKSHFSRGKHSVYTYARLEMHNGRKGDAFQVKAECTGKVNLGAIKGIVVAASDFTQFEPEIYKQRGKGLASYLIESIYPQSQMMIDHPRANMLCSPTSLSMVVESLTGKDIEPLDFANNVYDEGLGVFGNWGFNMAHAFEHTDEDLLFYTTRLSSFKDLYEILKQDIPVAVSVRGEIKGARKEYNNGHLLVVVGYDAKRGKVLCYDPAFDTHEEVPQAYDIHDFIVAWERSRRLTYKPELLV